MPTSSAACRMHVRAHILGPTIHLSGLAARWPPVFTPPSFPGRSAGPPSVKPTTTQQVLLPQIPMTPAAASVSAETHTTTIATASA